MLALVDTSPRTSQWVAVLLHDVAAIMRSFRCLDAVRLSPGVVPEAFESQFIFLRPNSFLLDPAADGNQKEHRPHRDSLIRQQFGQGIQLVEVVASD